MSKIKLTQPTGPIAPAHHYYVACFCGWATGRTLEAALQSLTGFMPKHAADVPVYVAIVRLPETAHYLISHYMPTTQPDGSKVPYVRLPDMSFDHGGFYWEDAQ